LNNSPRSADPETAKQYAIKNSIEVKGVYGDVNLALEDVSQKAKPDDLIFIGGSTYLVAELNNL
jgi:dihydrofolate synthase/folylpolyglutamate synthase